MFKYAWIATGTAFALGSLSIASSSLAATTPVWAVTSSTQASVTIDPATTIRANLPRTLYSFNMRYNLFEKELFDKNAWAVKTPIASQLVPLPNIFYRYPGGILGNHYQWEKAALSRTDRIAARKAGGASDVYPYFGTAEYLAMVKQQGGKAWWTLNLLGAGTDSKPVEYPSSTMAASNKKLAQYLKTNLPTQTQWTYQLGNELDRNIYEWPTSKYVSRSRDSINAILSVDPSAKFVAFMREFNWRLSNGTTSSASQFFKDVMTGLPMVNDFSLHFYYDGKLSPTSAYVTVPDMVSKVQMALGYAKAARPGNYNVWITEHAKRIYLSGGTSPDPNALDSALSVADFIVAMTQVPEVQGAGFQGLQGVPRTTFFKDTLSGTPAFWGLRMLNLEPYGRVLASRTTSPNKSGYPGGYDIRATGFANSTGTKLAVQAVNRHNQAMSLQIKYSPFVGKSKLMKHYYMAGKAGVDAATIDRTQILMTNPTAVSKAFGSAGALTVTLPPSSVSTITFE